MTYCAVTQYRTEHEHHVSGPGLNRRASADYAVRQNSTPQLLRNTIFSNVETSKDFRFVSVEISAKAFAISGVRIQKLREENNYTRHPHGPTGERSCRQKEGERGGGLIALESARFFQI